MGLTREESMTVIDGNAVTKRAQELFGNRYIGLTGDARLMQGESCACMWDVQVEGPRWNNLDDVLRTLKGQIASTGNVDLLWMCEYLCLLGELEVGMYCMYMSW